MSLDAQALDDSSVNTNTIHTLLFPQIVLKICNQLIREERQIEALRMKISPGETQDLPPSTSEQ